ncbi:hypothetical protein MSKOL_1761 [Methanosarcina sp. Kolksee]|uniref:Uncharacterized protein n=1 Tax=Methanosarcina vacuolata Z-761 TaxID=1434123 RepID=A0A0E3Q689_9EURY|nr:hypothetical protein MSVAZ_1785 [Methanosarcina vacuolata Z-761]AKB47538.1 hypothetical protein MSKOL_1761 [Methanosarcina sp. Kolksee]
MECNTCIVPLVQSHHSTTPFSNNVFPLFITSTLAIIICLQSVKLILYFSSILKIRRYLQFHVIISVLKTNLQLYMIYSYT